MELYIHIPFCIKKCSYCDFLSFETEENIKVQYIRKLIKEIKTCKTECRENVSTIFFGGGTPSVLRGDEIADIMSAVRSRFTIEQNAEISLEANPGTVTLDKLYIYRDAGINRLSIGLQSVNNDELRLLGRIHTCEEFIESFQLARKAGFDNINVDLMSALPGQTPETWLKTLKTVSGLEPEHISAYSLIIEENTPFYKKYGKETPSGYNNEAPSGYTRCPEIMDNNNVAPSGDTECPKTMDNNNVMRNREMGRECGDLPSEEEEREMYHDTKRILEEHGYSRYEISNYSLPGLACRHNQGYWERVNYLGFGLGAASLIENVRFHNTTKMKQYLNGNFAKEDKEYLTVEAQMEEYMFLGLRMSIGISISDFEKEFNCNFSEIYGVVTDKLKKEKLIKNEAGRLALTEKGIDLSNYVLAQYLL